MCTEEYDEICERLLRQNISATKLRKMNNTVLKNVLSQLMRLTLPGSKATIHSRSALLKKTGGRRTRGSSLVKIRKTLKKKKYKKNYRQKEYIQYPVQLKEVESFNSNKVKKKVDSFNNGIQTKITDIFDKVPIIYLKDILSTQARVSKSDFMEYFSLKAVNVPVSSVMGIKMADRDNHIASEDFKLRKIGRSERYVNRILVENGFNSRYTLEGTNSSKHSSPKIQKVNVFKYCTPVNVKVINLDLKRIKINMARRKRYSYLKMIKQMQKNIKYLKVNIKPCEKEIVDVLIKKKNFSNSQ